MDISNAEPCGSAGLGGAVSAHYIDPFEFAQRAPTDDERVEAEHAYRELKARIAADPDLEEDAAEAAWSTAECERLGVSEVSCLHVFMTRRWVMLAAEGLRSLPMSVVSAEEIDPFDFDNLPGLLGDVARWSLTFAFKPVREFAVASAIATMSVLFGRRFTTPTALGLNLYIVGLAPTGGGKEAALAAPQALLDEATFAWLLGPGDFASDSAIEASLRNRPCQLMTLDEFGQLLSAVQGRNAPTHAKLARKTLLEVYTKSQPGGRWTGKARASDDFDKASSPIYSPTLTLLACSTVEGFFAGLTEDNLGDGFVNRLTVVRANEIGGRNMDPARTVIPDDLVLAIRDAYAASKSSEGNMPRTSSDKPTLKPVPWADGDAEAAWLEVADWEDDERENAAGRDGVVGRAAEQTLKLATIAALARSPAEPRVSSDDVKWAFAVVRASIDTLDEGVRLNMAGSEFEALVKAIERAVVAAGPKGIAYSDLVRVRVVSKADDRMVKAAIERLRQMGAVEHDIGVSSAGGRPRNRVRLLTEH